MSKDKLLPCPFCGNPAPTLFDFDGEDWGVSCDIDSTLCKAQTVMVGSREQAIADWNRRAPTDETGRQQFDRLRAALVEIEGMHAGNPAVLMAAHKALRGVCQ